VKKEVACKLMAYASGVKVLKRIYPLLAIFCVKGYIILFAI
jgi:hypothetical protein